MKEQRGTTFILGAGASLHAGYPLIKTMGAELLAWMRMPRDVVYFDFAESADLLERQYGENIENIFNGMQADIAHRQQGYSGLANVHRPGLIEAMRQWFAEIQQQHAALAYQRFAAEVVSPGNTVVTFNYDVSLDSKLRESGKWEIGDGYGFRAEGLPTGSTVKLIKLHGSINWLAILFGGRRSGVVSPGGSLGSRPVFGQNDLTALGYLGLSDPIFPIASAAISPIVLPTSRKQFFFSTSLGREWETFWSRLWRSAKRAVRTSERIVLCGYGCIRSTAAVAISY